MLTCVSVLVAWKGDNREILSTNRIVISVFSVAGGATALQAFFILPWLWVRILREDWTLRWYHLWQGPFLLRRDAPPPTPFGYTKSRIKDYYRGHLTREELAYVRRSETLLQSIQTPDGGPPPTNDISEEDKFVLPPPAQAGPSDASPLPIPMDDAITSDNFIPPRPAGPWNSFPVMAWRFNRFLLRGIEQDVISMQKRNAVLKWDLEDMHARAERFDNRAEYMYSALQILTAAAASFTHGANDVANAIAPFTTAYEA